LREDTRKAAGVHSRGSLLSILVIDTPLWISDRFGLLGHYVSLAILVNVPETNEPACSIRHLAALSFGGCS
jgi:hypothetical protein